MTTKTSRRKPHPYDSFSVIDADGFRCMVDEHNLTAEEWPLAWRYLTYGRPSMKRRVAGMCYREPAARFVLEYGRLMKQAPRSAIEDPHRAPGGECYANSYSFYMGAKLHKQPGVDYVEGVAWGMCNPELHAWNTVGGAVFDLTCGWQDRTVRYLGVPIGEDFMRYMELLHGIYLGFVHQISSTGEYLENYVLDRRRKAR